MKTIDEKLKYLKRLINVYVKFFKHYKYAELKYTNDNFTIKYYGRKTHQAYYFKEKEIPIDNIDKYIISIKNKINREFSKRFNKTT